MNSDLRAKTQGNPTLRNPGTLLLACLALSTGCGSRAQQPPAHVPVIWINVDTFAARHSNVFGYERETTPALARLAEESIVFERYRSNASWTLPSTMSELTGVLPMAFLVPEEVAEGNERNLPLGGSHWQIPESRRTLAEVLQDSGFQTAAFIDNPYLHRGFGVAQGFSLWDTESAAIERADPSGGLSHMNTRMLAWLDGLAQDQPFFLFAQPFDAHGPYVPSLQNRRLFSDDGLTSDLGTAPVAKKGDLYESVIAPFARYHPDLDPEAPLPHEVTLGPMVDSYDRSLRTLDDALGELIAGLRSRGLLERSVLILSADHGESTVGHGSLFKHNQPWEDVLHVPLLIRLPGGAGGGRRIATNVQGVDLVPTLLELADVEARLPDLTGESLVPALQGESLQEERDLFAYADRFQTFSLVRGDWKLHYRRPRPGNPTSLLQLPEAQAWCRDVFKLPSDAVFDAEDLLALIAERPDREQLLTSWRELRSSLLQPRAMLFDLSNDPNELVDLRDGHRALAEQLRHSGLAIESRSLATRDENSDSEPGFAPEADLVNTLQGLGYGGSSSGGD